MVQLPFGIEIDLVAIDIWLRNLTKFEWIPDFDGFLKEELTFKILSERFMIALMATFNALESWFKLIFYVCRLMIHIISLFYPYIKPPIINAYKYWNSLDLTVQLTIIGFILFIFISIWIKRNRYIHKINQYFHKKCHKIKNWLKSKWNKIILWIEQKSKLTAKIFPHLVWWFILFSLIYAVPDHIYAAHYVILFMFCFIVPSVKTYSIIRKYSIITKSSSSSSSNPSQQKQRITQQIQECIDPLKYWLQFWSSRAFILFTFYLCHYILSYIPGFIVTFINDYIVINQRLFEIICDWTILWLLIMDSCLQFCVKQLTEKVFQLDMKIKVRQEIRSSSSSSSNSLADKISLSSINSLLSLLLKFIRPFVPSFIYNILHDGLYQFLIFFSFIFISPKFGGYILGYLLPIYISILALHNLDDLQYKISLWNNNQRHDLITPNVSFLESPSKNNGGLRSRKPSNGKHNNGVLSPPKNGQNRENKDKSSSWSIWSLMPTNMFSFHGTDDLSKNERKRQEMHKEANYVIQTIVDRLKYWIVFATLEWIYYFIGEQIGFKYFIPLWDLSKFALILWLQLPYIPYSTNNIYQYIIIPFLVLDITHIDHDNNYKKKNDDNTNDDDDDKTQDISMSMSPIQEKQIIHDKNENCKANKNSKANGKIENISKVSRNNSLLESLINDQDDDESSGTLTS